MNRETAKQLITECLIDGAELAEACTLVKHLTQVSHTIEIAELLLKARLHDDAPKTIKLGPTE